MTQIEAQKDLAQAFIALQNRCEALFRDLKNMEKWGYDIEPKSSAGRRMYDRQLTQWSECHRILNYLNGTDRNEYFEQA